ncbi:MAG: MerR family transcriptional regulator [Anaerolineae bacterium]|nr:MerR family transcriptional regulator [Anaerolineae bacterium]NIN97455.1 MerR family transcriptional regulator [Anaerolineae bacterium]NIQ80384.1 MerR family transcriptional regulator [Anaerolineae bacterium]
MENRDPLYDEPCYVISIAARMVELHPQTLRYYERVGLIRPQRSRGNRRLYSPRDIERLRAINRLVDDLGVNLAGVEVIFNMRKRMEEMQEEMDRLQAEAEEEIARLRGLLEDVS